jgi:TonB family protein
MMGALLLIGPRGAFAQEEPLSNDPMSVGESMASVTQDQRKNKPAPAAYAKYDVAPEIVKQIQPDYPDEAMKNHVEGTVWLQLLVGNDGRVLESKVQKSEAEVFNQAAITAGMQWLFKPASAEGKPIAVWITVPFRFKLMNGQKTGEGVKAQEKLPPPDHSLFEKAPEAIKTIHPKYPEAAKKEKLEGTVWLKVWIDESGRVANVAVHKSDAQVFDSAAIAAVRQWKFTPAMSKEKPVAVWVSIPFRFKLSDNEKSSSSPVPGLTKKERQPPAADAKVDKAPEALNQADPKYPENALRDKIEGTVWVRMWIDESGNVVDAVIAKSDTDVLNEAAIDAGKQWKFKPALLKGKPVAVWITIPFRFKIAGK